MASGKTKVFIIDDSAVIRQLLTQIFNDAYDLEVVGTAQDPIFARSKIESLRPDVITLDVEMPRMDGLSFLSELMRTDPIPVVMVSSLTHRSCETTLRAIELGAVDFVSKPELDISAGIAGLGDEIISKVRIAAKAKVRRVEQDRQTPVVSSVSMRSPVLDTRRIATTDRIIAIGASTGGTQAISEIITSLPVTVPGIVIVQHMPPVFTRSFAERLNIKSALEVREARDGDRVIRGLVLIAPGGRHMAVRRSGAMYHVELTDGLPVNFVKPSVDILFKSVAQCAGKNAIGVILTGMGEDGARGLKEMKECGAFTIAQDEASCVIFGMPKKAIELGAAGKIVALEMLPGAVLEHT
ncbi:MAG: chemotaxis response regulator protein-glutamate methylesterase [Nitrospirae bacterium]|nr:chemotaxis response regulator protein-glutamate methylesterase [Nitrospirota bacterium]